MPPTFILIWLSALVLDSIRIRSNLDRFFIKIKYGIKKDFEITKHFPGQFSLPDPLFPLFFLLFFSFPVQAC
jgi:hypothetical protein